MARYYEKDGKKLVSVTTIISDCCDKSAALTAWAANMVCLWIRENCRSNMRKNKMTGDEEFYYNVFEEDLQEAKTHFRDVSKTALDIGSQVHAAIEDYFLTGTVRKLKGQAMSAFNAFLEFKDKHKMIPDPDGIEQKVYSDYWAGTLDYKGLFDGKLYTIDFKSSKAIYMDSMGPQIAAYHSLTNAECSGILRLDKETGLPEFKDTTKRHFQDLAIFNTMVDLYFLRHPRIAKAAGWWE
jgi:hypothetical protein